MYASASYVIRRVLRGLIVVGIGSIALVSYLNWTRTNALPIQVLPRAEFLSESSSVPQSNTAATDRILDPEGPDGGKVTCAGILTYQRALHARCDSQLGQAINISGMYGEKSTRMSVSNRCEFSS